MTDLNAAAPAASNDAAQLQTQINILRSALGAMLGGQTEAALVELETGLDLIASTSDPEEVAIARQAIAAMRLTAPGVELPPDSVTFRLKLDASQAIEQTKDAQTGLQLLAKVRAFIEKHDLGCPESLFQRDNPQIDALTVMGDLCELAGWKRDEDDEE